MIIPLSASGPIPWLPNVDLHVEAGDLILHAEMASFEQGVEVRCEGDVLIVEESPHAPAPSVHCGRLRLPFELPSPPQASWPAPGILEVRIHVPA